MIDLLALAERIKTPLALSALGLLILFLIFRQIVQRLPVEKVRSSHVFELLKLILRLLFWLTIVIAILAVTANVVGQIFDRSPERLAGYIANLSSQSQAEREASVQALVAITESGRSSDAQICASVTAFIRGTARRREAMESSFPSDRGGAVRLLSNLLRENRCSRVNLRHADLRRLELEGLDLHGVDLLGAWFDEAVIPAANLSNATLIGANFEDAILRGADLRGADLSGSYLESLDLRCADLRGVRGLSGSNLVSTRLEGARPDAGASWAGKARSPTSGPCA